MDMGDKSEHNVNGKNIMNYIGFSTQTHKIYAKILCKKFRHCAPIIIYKDKCVLYQFICPKNIVPIIIKRRDLRILEHYGWIFVKYNNKFNYKHILNNHALTCVQFTKSVCNVNKRRIQTPDALLKYLNQI